MKRHGWVLGIWCGVAAVASHAWADGVIRDGLGARSTGRGGSNIAFADTGVIIYDNPGGMTNVAGCGLAEAGFDILLPNTAYGDTDNPGGIDGADNPFPAGQVSIIRKFNGGRLALGAGFFAPAGFGSDYLMNGPGPFFAGPQQYKSLGMMMKFLPGAAYQVTDRLSVGATLGVGINHMELEGPYSLQSPGQLQGTPALFDLQATGAAPVWSVGLQYKATPRTTLGLSYLAETRFHNHGDTVMQIPGVGVNEYQTDLQTTWPQSLGLGVKHRLLSQLTVAADVIWFDWSNAKESYTANFSEPTNPVVATLAPTLTEEYPLNWRDSVTVRLGSEYSLCGHRTLRAGYVYHRNPIPDDTLTPWIQTTLEHGVSAGYGWRLMRVWNVDLAYQYNWGNPRNVGDSSFVGDDFSNSRMVTEAHWAYFSVMRQF